MGVISDRPDNNIHGRRAFEALGLEFTLTLSTNEALVEYEAPDRRASMMLLTGNALGLYLKALTPEDTFLSLGDRHALSDVVCFDDWECSRGLFVPVDQA
jgi:hypothetical protein